MVVFTTVTFGVIWGCGAGGTIGEWGASLGGALAKAAGPPLGGADCAVYAGGWAGSLL